MRRRNTNGAPGDDPRPGLSRAAADEPAPRGAAVAALPAPARRGAAEWIAEATEPVGGPVAAFRFGFYLLMCYNWTELELSPLVGWKAAFAFPAAPWAAALAPKTEAQSALYRGAGSALALAATRSDIAAAAFLPLYVLYLATAASNFTNHDYLFALIAFLVPAHSVCGGRGRSAWLHAMRGQIVVVYFFAALWKTHPEWVNGTMVRDIFISFEEQGVARGVPWAAISAKWPHVWLAVAWGGLALDGALAAALSLLRPGATPQLLCLCFHGFTAFTMSQRIGYIFPSVMVLSILLFVPRKRPPPPANARGGKADGRGADAAAAAEDAELRAPHAAWFVAAARGGRHRRALAWLAVQWLMPARMLLVAPYGRVEYTAEAYRFSWTMMLHGRGNALFYFPLMDLRPYCGNSPYPNALAEANAREHKYTVPFLPSIGNRGYATVSTYAQQLPSIAQFARDNFLGAMCNGPVTVHASVFTSANGGPFARVVDPTMDLAAWADALGGRSALRKVLGAVFEPEGIFLRGNAFGRAIPRAEQRRWKAAGFEAVTDRSACLGVDPLKLAAAAQGLTLWLYKSPAPLAVTACLDFAQADCRTFELEASEAHDASKFLRLPVVRSVSIGMTGRDAGGPSCSDVKVEDVALLIKLGYD